MLRVREESATTRGGLTQLCECLACQQEEVELCHMARSYLRQLFRQLQRLALSSLARLNMEPYVEEERDPLHRIQTRARRMELAEWYHLPIVLVES